MSSYQSTSTTIEVVPSNLELISAQLAAAFGSPVERLSCRQLITTRDSLTTSLTLSEASSLIRPCVDAGMMVGRGILGISTVTGSAGSPQLDRILSATQTRELQRELDNAIRLTALAERRTTSELLQQCLRPLNYHMRIGESATRSVIEARRGHSVVLMAVGEHGDVEIDTIGHDENDCVEAIDEICASAASVGLRISVRRRDDHNDPSGGTLIRRAAVAGDGDLVVGACAEADAIPVTSRPHRAAQRVRSDA